MMFKPNRWTNRLRPRPAHLLFRMALSGHKIDRERACARGPASAAESPAGATRSIVTRRAADRTLLEDLENVTCSVCRAKGRIGRWSPEFEFETQLNAEDSRPLESLSPTPAITACSH